MIVVSHSAEETIEIGKTLGKALPPSSVLCFFGDLAAGKTTLIKGIVSEATGKPPESVISPTFVLMNIYEGNKPVYHFDLYRLNGSEEFLSLGFDEYLQSNGISCIEWSERIDQIIPKNAIRITMRAEAYETRLIHIEGVNS